MKSLEMKDKEINLKMNIDISRFFENEIIRNQRQLKKLQNETNILILEKMVIVKFVIIMSINQ